MNTTPESNINKDLILRERLAIQRTRLANQTTLLSFIRTALYFLVAGLSIHNLLHIENSLVLEFVFFSASFGLLLAGIVNYFRQKKIIQSSEQHVGDYKREAID